MISKKCTGCNELKSFDEMSKDKSKNDGMSSKCKKCKNQSSKNYAKTNPDKVKLKIQKWREDNPEYRKEYYKKNKGRTTNQNREYYEKNQEEILEKSRNRWWENRQKELARGRKYKKENREAIYDYRNKWRKEKRMTDELFRLKQLMRSRMGTAFRAKGYSKKSKTHEILGCSYESLKERLENNPYGFIIDDPNMDIDHIIPLSSASNERELLKLCQADNLQLLPSEYNRDFKKANRFDKEHFEAWLKKHHLL